MPFAHVNGTDLSHLEVGARRSRSSSLAADADALRDHLGLEEVAVLGHSYGGCVALQYALRYPPRVSHLLWSEPQPPGTIPTRSSSSCGDVPLL